MQRAPATFVPGTIAMSTGSTPPSKPSAEPTSPVEGSGSRTSFWTTAQFKGKSVLVRANAKGEPVVHRGMIDVRYGANTAKIYRGSEKNLDPASLNGAVVSWTEPLDAPATSSAATSSAATSRGGRTTAAKGRGAAGRNSRPKAGDAASVPAPREGAIVLYTDGACTGNPGPAGAGVVYADGELTEGHYFYLGHGTNNVGELTAIWRAVELVGDTDRPVDLYTDSDYAIGVLTRGWKAKANGELIAKTKVSLKRLTDLQIHWIPGHAGVPLNERADELARRAIQERASGSDLA